MLHLEREINKTKAEESLVTVKMNYVISNDISHAQPGFNFASK